MCWVGVDGHVLFSDDMERIDKLKQEFESRKNLIQKLRLKLEEEENKAISLLHEIYKLDPSMVQVMCFNCGGVGYLKVEDRRKVCEICQGNGYLWMRVWRDEATP